MPTLATPKVGDLVWFKSSTNAKSEVGQLLDIKLPCKTVVVYSQNREVYRVPIELVECNELLSAGGPLGDGSVSWDDWQQLDTNKREILVWPFSSGK